MVLVNPYERCDELKSELSNVSGWTWILLNHELDLINRFLKLCQSVSHGLLLIEKGKSVLWDLQTDTPELTRIDVSLADNLMRGDIHKGFS